MSLQSYGGGRAERPRRHVACASIDRLVRLLQALVLLCRIAVFFPNDGAVLGDFLNLAVEVFNFSCLLDFLLLNVLLRLINALNIEQVLLTNRLDDAVQFAYGDVAHDFSRLVLGCEFFLLWNFLLRFIVVL